MERPRLLARFVAEKKAVAQANSSNTHGRSFTIPAATHWYSFYQCLVNVIRNRDAVVNVLDDDEFMKSYKDTKKRRTVSTKAPMKAKKVSKSVKSKSRKVRANEAQEKKFPKQLAFEKIARHVRDESFWEKGEQALKLLEPIIKNLGLMEADETCISMVYWAFTDLLKKPMYREPTFLVDTATAILVLIKARWNKMHTDAIGIAFFLDPSQDPDGFVGDDRIDTKNQIRKVAKRLGFSKAEVNQCFHEAAVFWNRKRDWTPKQRNCVKRTAALEWWGEERDKYPILFRIARRIFTMPTSSAASERNWSTHKYISSDHLDLRNKRADSLYWKHMEKRLPDVVFDLSTLGEEAMEITFEEGYEEDDAVSSCSDDDDDDIDSSNEDDANSEEEKTQEAMNYAADYSFDF